MFTSTLPHQPLLDSAKLLDYVRSGRLPLAKRLRLLAQLANNLEEYLRQLPRQPLPTADEAAGQPANPLASSAPVAVGGLGAGDVARLLDASYAMVQSHILPRLRRRHLRVAKPEEISAAQQEWIYRYFRQRIYPLLTPVAVDPARPFPHVVSGSLYFLVTLQAVGQYCRLVNGVDQSPHGIAAAHPTPLPSADREIYGLIQLCSAGPRLVEVLSEDRAKDVAPTLLWREDIVSHFIDALFPQMAVTGLYQFRILRAVGALPPPLDDAPALLGSRESTRSFYRLRTQQSQIPVVHVDVEQRMPAHLIQWLTAHLHTSPASVLSCPTPLGIADLSKLADYLQ